MRRTRKDRAGHTLLEILIATSILGVIVGGIALVASSGTRLFRSSTSRTELEARARRALSRIQDELLSGGHGSLAVFPQSPLWDDRIIFDRPVDISTDRGEVQWSSTLIEFRYEDGELDDGLDNDGDGLVDEGMVVLMRDFGGLNEPEIVLCRGVREYLEGEVEDANDENGNLLVDEKGLTFDLRDGALSIRLSLQRVDSEGVVVTRTFETTVWLRN